MTARYQMKMRADVERDASGAADAWGQKPMPSWGTHLSDVSCLVWTQAKRQIVGGGANEKVVIIEDIRSMVPLGTDVAENDRFTNVKDRNGTTLFSGPFNIDKVQRRRTHLELLLSKAAS